MQIGDKIEFTPEQRNRIVNLYARAILARDASERAQDRASIAIRVMWDEIHEMLGLEDNFHYSLIADVKGVEAIASAGNPEIVAEMTRIIKSWKTEQEKDDASIVARQQESQFNK